MIGQTFLLGMFAAIIPLAVAQQPAAKSYRDPSTGVTFKVPPAWKLDTTGTQGTMMMPKTADGTNAKPQVAFTFRGSVFAYISWPALDIVSCTRQLQEGESSDTPESVTIAGTEFQEFSVENDGACHEQRDTLDVAFVRGQCVAFDQQTNASCLPLDTDEGRALAVRESVAAETQLDRIMESVRIDLANSRLTRYEDSAHGVSFQYPASWKREAMQAGELGGEILPGSNGKPPFHGVSLVSPVGYFRYRVIPGGDAASCSRTVQWAIDQDDTPPHSVSIGGVPFRAVSFSAPVTGQSFEGTVFWSFRRGNCYLFETDMYTHPASPDADRALMALRRKVRAEYKDVIRSIHLAGSTTP